jgi:HD-GYP domain-containing protein (c-di-GMP phosphodiesterase class II)
MNSNAATLGGKSRGAISRDFFPVRVAGVPVSGDFRLPIHLWNEGTRRYTLYRDTGTAIQAADLKRLADAGVTTVYLASRDYSEFQRQLRETLDVVVRDEKVAVPQRVGVLNEVVRDVLRDAFRWRKVSKAVAQTGDLANHVVDLLCRDDLVASELSSVLHFDSATFTHSANVSFYCVLLAHALGYSDPAVLKSIAAGALLHDIGKLDVPEAILGKRGPLSPEERELVRRHPTTGLLTLKPEEGLEFGQLMMVYQHHERIDGSGYPCRMVGNEIHDWARMCAVVDVFEALTSDRPYRARSFPTDAALTFIEESPRGGLDPELFKCWKMTIGVR